jgi:hypothetical protein
VTDWRLPINVAIAAVLVFAVAFAVCLIAAWVAQEWGSREDALDPDDGYFGAVTGGDTLSPRSLGEIRRRLALDSPKATTNAVIKSMRRHQRRLTKRGQR